MYILNGAKDQIVNLDFVERVCISRKEDAALLVLSYGVENPPVTLSRYKTVAEARDALNDLYLALAGGQDFYELPESVYYHEENIKKDARTKRKGGS